MLSVHTTAKHHILINIKNKGIKAVGYQSTDNTTQHNTTTIGGGGLQSSCNYKAATLCEHTGAVLDVTDPPPPDVCDDTRCNEANNDMERWRSNCNGARQSATGCVMCGDDDCVEDDDALGASAPIDG